MPAAVRDEAFRFGVLKDQVVVSVRFEIFRKLRGVILRHTEVVHQIVTAVDGGRPRHAFGFGDRSEGAEDEVVKLARRALALEDEIETREAAHGTPVYHLVLPFGVVAKVCRDQMLERVHRSDVDDRLAVGALQPHVVGRDGVFSETVDAARENAGYYSRMVYRKALYKFHIQFSV